MNTAPPAAVGIRRTRLRPVWPYVNEGVARVALIEAEDLRDR